MKALSPLVSTIYAALVAQALASNSAADVTLATVTIPANVAAATMTLDFSAFGNSDNGTTAGTFNIWVKVGATKIATIAITTTTTAKTLQSWAARFMLTFRTVGAGGTMICAGIGQSSAPATNVPLAVVPTATTAVATNAAVVVTMGMNWTAANASNIGRCDHAKITLNT